MNIQLVNIIIERVKGWVLYLNLSYKPNKVSKQR